ncbi:IS3 family transposase [Bacillus paranthracis]
MLEYIHYYNCVRIQEKLNHLSPKNLGNKWFRCFDWCPVFGGHFIPSGCFSKLFVIVILHVPLFFLIQLFVSL